ncbi:hypothetical protein [Candidatus Nitrotoga sp. 1052]|uniref:hypothetical protein n=1 Tax=Candidatus Nitrotoga sp. 1052 TaxID=2886964 RepID=UPI001EF47E44|nr:hypothetical protein [Candidatus Nitrotoga sp. 1052]
MYSKNISGMFNSLVIIYKFAGNVCSGSHDLIPLKMVEKIINKNGPTVFPTEQIEAGKAGGGGGGDEKSGVEKLSEKN